MKCSSGGKCIEPQQVDCGKGTICAIGERCWSPPGAKQTSCATPQRIAKVATLKKEREKLWAKDSVGQGKPQTQINFDKLNHDWAALNLARASYNDSLRPGDYPFRNDQNWIVADKKTNSATGFLAYTFKNEQDGRVVVAVQGSRSPSVRNIVTKLPDFTKDWSQDIAAYGLGKKPSQFDDATAYIRSVKTEYGGKYVVDCAGHSLGGGACAYAAARVSDVHAVTINPITYTNIKTRNGHFIDNYVAAGEIADFGNRIKGKTSPGWYYGVPIRERASAQPSGIAGSTPAIAPYTRNELHDLDLTLDALAAKIGQKRPTQD